MSRGFCPDTKVLEHSKDSFLIYYNNNVHVEGIRFICGPRLVIIGLSERRVDLINGKIRPQMNLTQEKTTLLLLSLML